MPDGTTEYWYLDRLPEVRSRYLHRGEEYEVVGCDSDGGSSVALQLGLPPRDDDSPRPAAGEEEAGRRIQASSPAAGTPSLPG